MTTKPRTESRWTAPSILRCLLWITVLTLATRAIHLGSRDVRPSEVPQLQLGDVQAVPATIDPHEATFVAYTSTVAELVEVGKTGVVVTRALRSDGASVMRAEYLPPDQPATMFSQRLVRLPDGTRVDLDDIRELAFAVRTRPRDSAALERDPRHDCLRTYRGTEVSGRTAGDVAIGGLRAISVERDGATKWFALDYGCAEIQSRRQPELGVPLQALTKIRSGEPERALFEVPSHYREALPSTVYRLPVGSQRATDYDEWYRRSRIDLSALR
jgi:hypothetical protein